MRSHLRRRPQCRLQQKIARHRSVVSRFPGATFDIQKAAFLTQFYDVVRPSCSKSNDVQIAHSEVFDWLRDNLPPGIPLTPEMVTQATDPASHSTSQSSGSQSTGSAPCTSSQSAGNSETWLSQSSNPSPIQFWAPGADVTD